MGKSRLAISIPTASFDARFYGRYPHGDAPSGVLSVAVSGSNLISGSGNPMRLLGCNVSGLESGIIFDVSNSTNFWQSSNFPSRPSFALMASWGQNCVRLPLNEDCWLGLTVQTIPGTSKILAGAAYRAEVAACVAAANAVGMIVILDLHWTAPGTFCANTQNPFLNAANSITFWTSVANAFKGNPAVVFELFNEPYIFSNSQANGAFAGSPAVNSILLNGGTATGYFGLDDGTSNGTSIRVANSYSIAGYQAAIDAVRATGATNVIVLGGQNFDTDLTWIVSNPPNDPLNQLAVTAHTYRDSGNIFFTNLSAAVTMMQNCGMPVVLTEIGDQIGSGASTSFISSITGAMDAHGWSGTAWTWNSWFGTSAGSNSLISDNSATPTVGEGAFWKAFCLSKQLRSAASDAVTAAGALSTGVKLAGAASDAVSAAGVLPGSAAALAGAAVTSIIGAGSLALPVPPSSVQIILQGNAKAGDNQGLGGDGHGPGTVVKPNQQSIGWLSVPGASQYNIYRSTTTAAGTNGLYTQIDSIFPAAAATNYSAYVTSCTNANSGSPFDAAPGIDSVYTDTAATGCVSATDAKGPSSGIYYGAVTGYTYKVTAVVGGVESMQSTDSIAIFMGGGKWVMCAGIFNLPPTVTKSTAAPAASPLGFLNATFMKLGHFPATQAFVNPFSGSGCVWGNLNVTGFNFMVVNVYPTAWHNGDMQQSTEIDGDLFIYNTVIESMNVTLNQWNTFKFPLSSFLNSTKGSGSTMASAANGVRQTSFYKTTWNNGAALNTDMTFYWESYFSVT